MAISGSIMLNQTPIKLPIKTVGIMMEAKP